MEFQWPILKTTVKRRSFSSFDIFLRMALKGPALEREESQSLSTIGQLMIFNYISKQASKRSKPRSLPLTTFLGFYCHSPFRNKDFINFHSKIGLSDNYKKVIHHERSVVSALSKKFKI